MMPVLQTTAIPSLEEMEELSNVPEDELVQSVLRKGEGMRSREDCLLLQRATARFKFFKSIETEQHFELCRAMTTQRFRSDQHVFEQGDQGSTFYIIYQGGVKVWVNDGKGVSKVNDGGYGTCVATLLEGDSFGELALIGNGTRSGTAITTGPTQLLRVEKDAYDESLLKMHKIQHETRTEFLRDIFLFSDWEDTELTRLAKVLTGKKYEKNTTIIKQGKTTDQMYFIVSGRCRVLKRMSLSNDLQDKLMSVRARASEVGLHQGNMTSSLGSSTSSTTSMMSPRGAVGDEPWLEICELTAGQYFGERALLDGRRNAEHTASVVTITRAEILILSKYDFYRNIDERTQELMREYAGKFYFDEDKIRRTITKQHRWDSYKKDVMREALSPRHSEGGAAGR